MEKISKVILSNMCLVENDKHQICFIFRHKNDWPGLNLPGGHVENNETLEEAVIREMKEETGLEIFNPKLCAVKEWPWGEDLRYLGFLYYVDEFKGELRSSEEGEVIWLTKEEMYNYRLSEGLEELMDLIIKNK